MHIMFVMLDISECVFFFRSWQTQCSFYFFFSDMSMGSFSMFSVTTFCIAMSYCLCWNFVSTCVGQHGGQPNKIHQRYIYICLPSVAKHILEKAFCENQKPNVNLHMQLVNFSHEWKG